MEEGSLGLVDVFIVNNGGLVAIDEIAADLPPWMTVRIFEQRENRGFGYGHNIALGLVDSDFHLVLNPDVELEVNALVEAIRWLLGCPETVLLAPEVFDVAGGRSYLCREKPTVGVLFLRSFAPKFLSRLFGRQLKRYEMRDQVDRGSVVWDPPVISGCFMLFRTSALKALGGFDSRYFLYFEDYDLSHRAKRIGRSAFVPSVRIVHSGGGASRKGVLHIVLFIRSAFRYFRTYGWGRDVVFPDSHRR
ncbi:hypothetical protein [Niveibacterium sp.]|uniref:hypothetical protein n=1 Tax=Niveibacterium sp. TaxID=2017444 RepID=UPI0035B414E7